uniref:Uncharacterized protein n=1 Tax=Meloidogyne hapla TaxID=6305 RepID=A0A1I8BNC9_MELHA
MVSQLVKENIDFLQKLARTKSQRKVRRLLRLANSQHLLTLAEICLNIVKSRFNLSTRQKKRLLPYVDFVRRMSRARSERGARKILNQKGSGFGGVFAALITPILIELARSFTINSKT